MANTILWKFLRNIWDSGDDKRPDIESYLSYWNGDLKREHRRPDQTKTASNIVKPIVETKLKSVLDAQFTLAVMPIIKTFSDLQSIKDSQVVADVFYEELKNILKENHIQAEQEKVGRAGLIGGFGAIQTLWDTNDDIRGKIKLSYIDNKALKWDQNATCIEDASFIGYTVSLNASLVKDRYCKNEDGSYNEEKCQKINEITIIVNQKKEESLDDPTTMHTGVVINYENTVLTGQAYVGTGNTEHEGIQSNKIVKLIVLFLLDNSLYAPDEHDDKKLEKQKEKFSKKYPNGRMVIFSESSNQKIIFEDSALDESFKNLGNIDIFNPMKTDKIYGRSEVEDLYTIQNRINALYIKYRTTIKNSFSTLIMDKTSVPIAGSALVRHPVLFVEGLNEGVVRPFTVSNNGIEEAARIMDMIASLKSYAYELARVNETMLFGTRQSGTTSASQIEALQESPLTDIRQIQRNFKDFMIEIGEKCLTLIQDKYTFDRLITLNVAIEGAKYAKIKYKKADYSPTIEPEEKTSNESQEPLQPSDQIEQLPNIPQKQEDSDNIWIELLDEAGKVIKEIKTEKNWEFKIDVIAGTEIPRSKKESAELMNNLIDKGLLGDISNLTLLEEMLRINDVPNWRTIMTILKNKEKEEQENPKQYTIEDVISNPEIGKSFADVFKSLDGFSQAKSQILETIGLNPNTDTLDTAPVADIMSQSDTLKTSLLVPQQISNDPEVQAQGLQMAKEQEILNIMK